jgi:membrane protein YqaA with SNARE-associated domain
MIWVYASIFGASVASALLPLINIEAILAVTISQQDDHAVALVVAATLGQMVGKILWYWGAVEVERAPWVRRQLEKPKAQATLQRWHERAEGRPWFTGGLLFVSAFTGFPPFAVLSVLAGQLRMSLTLFLALGLVGRWLRFAAVLGGAAWLSDLMR